MASKTMSSNGTGTLEVVKFGRVELPRFEDPQHPDFVPDPIDYRDPFGNQERVAWAWLHNKDVMVRGDTGQGKTSMIEDMCARMNRAFRRVQCHGDIDMQALMGKPSLEVEDGASQMYFQTGIVYDAVLNGHVLLLDDYNLAHPDVRGGLFSLHSTDGGFMTVLDHEGEVLPRHPDFRLVVTGNPYGYAGVKDWNQANMRRYGVVINMKYLPEADETQLLVDQVPDLNGRSVKSGEALGLKMVQTANVIRTARKDGAHEFPFSFDELLNWGQSVPLFGIRGGAEMTVVPKVDDVDQPQIREAMENVIGTEDFGPAADPAYA